MLMQNPTLASRLTLDKKVPLGSQNASSIQSFKRLFHYSAKYKKDYRLGTLFSFLNKVFDIAPEILIGIAIDVVVNKEQSFIAKLGVPDVFMQLIYLSVLTLVIWGFESVFEYLYLLRWKNLAQSIQYELRKNVYDHLQKLDMSFFGDANTGHLVTLMNDDVNQLERFLNEGINKFIQVFSAVTLIGLVFLVVAPKIAIFAFLPIPIIIFGAFFFQKRATPLYLDVRLKAALIGARLTNNIEGMATIRSFNAQGAEAGHVRQDSENYVDSNRLAIRLSSAFKPLIRMAVLSGFLTTFIFGGKMALDGTLNVGLYGVLVFLTQRLLWPLTDFADTVDLFERAMASTKRILDLLEVPIGLEKSLPTQTLDPQAGIQIKRLGFEYIPGFPVLEDFNLEVPAGKTIAIVGPTGSGKSTLTKVLMRFHEYQKGEIQFLGKDLRSISPDEVRNEIGLVSQDTFLFPGTVFENIAYGRTGASEAEVVRVAKEAHAWEFIEKLPQGIHTLIGERGQKLSGGQKQRLHLARVILKNAPVLILDEATSAVDNDTETLIQQSLLKASVGKTTIIIAHRLSTVLHADTIYVLSHGKIQEQGRHQELLEKKGLYHHLWHAKA